jgi:8-oxo-dGTP pyrophosphatase MutT (NUDIX family)
MNPMKSAGILAYRKKEPGIEFFLVHPGGPYFSKKDKGWWTIPKGEIGMDEEPLPAAIREFEEETGAMVKGHFIPLKSIVQKGGKTVMCWVGAKAEIVQEVYKKYLAGWPVFDIYHWAKEHSFNNTGNGAIQRLMERPIYAGLVKVTGTKSQPEKYVKGLHQPLISEADYWQAQDKLGNRRHTKSTAKRGISIEGHFEMLVR